MSLPLVSIILTVYNGEKTILKTLESLISQSYLNIEIIIVDDISTDDTKIMIKNFIISNELQSKVRYFSTPKKGRSTSLNYAISQCNGKYVANIDADDLSHPNRIEKQVKFLQAYPDISLVASKALIIFENQLPQWDKIDLFNYKYKKVDNKIKYTNPILHPSVMINMENMNKDKFHYNESLDKVIDYDLWLRLFNENFSMVILEDELVAKRIHKYQSYENKKRFDYLKAIRKVQLDRNDNLTLKETVFINLKFLYGVLPQKLRMKIRGQIE
ncbi:glycosyltransferase family 2 protein [Enterococcus sp. N342-3-1-2]